jgi:hypothetical protein
MAEGRGADDRRPRPRSRFITWLLAGTGAAVLVLALWDRQETLPELSEWDVHLASCGRTLVFTDTAAHLRTEAEGAELVSASDRPALEELGRTASSAELAQALVREGFGCVLVSTGLRDPEAAAGARGPVASLASYRSGDHLAARMLREDAALYAPAEPPQVAEETLAFLVGAVRRRLAGEGDAPAGAPDEATREREGTGWDVAVQIQGLAPRRVRSARANRIRHDLFAAGQGASLLDAALDAAAALERIWERKHEQREGSLHEAMDRLRLELHVMYELALIDHHRDDLDPGRYGEFLDRVIEPGMTGLALGWTPFDPYTPPVTSETRVRLPPDVVYWSRPDGIRAVERIAADARLNGFEDLAATETITLDRFRSIHVMEQSPGGDVVGMLRGRARVDAPDPARAEAFSALVAGKLAADARPDGTLRMSYYPVRDSVSLRGSRRPADLYDPLEQGLGTLALLLAADADADAVREASRDALARLLDDAVFCGHDPQVELRVPARGGGAAAVPAARRWAECGPLDEQGRPGPWAGFRRDAPPEERPMAMIVHRSTAEVTHAAAALAALMSRPDDPASFEPLALGLVGFLETMQRPDGWFDASFVQSDHPRTSVQEPAAGALALWALALARSRLDDESIDGPLERGIDAGLELLGSLELRGGSTLVCARLRGLAPFLALAAQEAGDARAARQALAGVVDLCLVGPDEALRPDLAGGYVGGGWRTPGVADVLVAAAARRVVSGADAAHVPARLGLAADLGGEAALRVTVVPGVSDHMFPVPGRARWGVGRDLLDHRQRPSASLAVLLALAPAG